MLDEDLAELYGVETRVLNQAVARNIIRFPSDFMFKLSEEDFRDLKSQYATSSWEGRRKLPNAFTEHGILMLSNVLNSKQAIRMVSRSCGSIPGFVKCCLHIKICCCELNIWRSILGTIFDHLGQFNHRFNALKIIINNTRRPLRRTLRPPMRLPAGR